MRWSLIGVRLRLDWRAIWVGIHVGLSGPWYFGVQGVGAIRDLSVFVCPFPCVQVVIDFRARVVPVVKVHKGRSVGPTGNEAVA